MVFRRSLVLLLVLVTFGVAACGDGDPPTQVSAGGEPAATSTTATAVTSVPVATTSTTEAASTTAVEAPIATTTTTAAPDPADGSAASPVPGLDAAELQAALAVPTAAAGRSIPGPTVDQIVLADGTKVWRVRVPGSFQARSARVSVTVGDRRVGEGVLAPDLQAITAVTTDGTGLTPGRAVSYQWEGGPSVPAGTLAVVR